VRGHPYRGRDSLSYSAPRDAPAKLALKANDVLRRNDMGGWTKAAPELYPHQWSWDSAFIAIGLAHLDTRRAARELETLFACQWKTGKVPHIVFNERAHRRATSRGRSTGPALQPPRRSALH
jgi:hypothetical protein